MKTTATIRGEIERFMKERHLTINQFARIAGINSGTLSSLLNGGRPISMKQLDQITSAMGLDEGHFYEEYIHECIFQAKPDWRRLGPFLNRCAELGKLDCLDIAARMILDNTNYLPMLFEMAEELRLLDKIEAALTLYQCVAESEKFQHSERLALCQYRIFSLSLNHNEKSNLQAAINFEPYVDRLDERYQLDGYKELIDVFLSLHWWDKIPYLTDKMDRITTYEYSHTNEKERLLKTRKKPLIFYKLYAQLVKANYYRQMGDYDSALHYVTLYANPNWVEAPTALEFQIINKFKQWAIANRYLYKLMNNQFEVLEEYLDYVSSKENDTFTALCSIVLAANQFQYPIDSVLERYKEYLVNKAQQEMNQISLNSYTRLQAELGIYYLNAKQHERGLTYIVDSLEYSIRIRSDKGMLRCMGIFEQFRQHASTQTLERYQSLISEVQKLSVYAWMPVV